LLHQQGTSRVRRYPSDTTDAQWAVINPLLPDPAWLGTGGGRPEQHCRRAPTHREAMVCWAMIRITSQRLARA